MTNRRLGAALAVFVLLVGVTGVATAKSLYVIANWSGTYSAYNINPGGTVTWQANYGSSYMPPVGMALHDASATLFVTFEGRNYVDIVDAVTMTSLGTPVTTPGASNLAGIDVDDINDVVYAADRWTDDLYAYDWDPVGKILTLKAGFPIDLANCAWPRGAFGIAVDEIAGRLYLACSEGSWSGGGGSGSVHVYRMSDWAEIDRFDPIIPPVGIAIDRIRGLVFTTAPTTGCASAPSGFTKLSRFDLVTRVESWHDMGHGGMGLAVDETTGYLYATGGCDGDDLSVWNTATSPFTMMQTTGPIGNSPAGLTIGNVSYNPLNLTKDDGFADDECAVPGWQIGYEVCFENDNPFDVDSVVLTDNLPPEVAFVSASHGGAYDGVAHTVTWNYGTLHAGDELCFDLVAALDIGVAPESLFTNLVTIVSGQTPPTTVEEETEVCPIIPVPFDVKPTSCRNPLNVSSRGKLPTAVLGTADFDVTQVDPASLRLEGVPPLFWAFEDVATPYEPYLGKEDMFDCTDEGPDGWLDLTVKFNRLAVAAALGDPEHGDVLSVFLTGNLKPEFGGMPILGEDVVVILKKK